MLNADIQMAATFTIPALLLGLGIFTVPTPSTTAGFVASFAFIGGRNSYGRDGGSRLGHNLRQAVLYGLGLSNTCGSRR
jgi:hypothetical protein